MGSEDCPEESAFSHLLKVPPRDSDKVLWTTWVSENFSLFARDSPTQTVFGLLDELTIHVKGVKEGRGP